MSNAHALLVCTALLVAHAVAAEPAPVRVVALDTGFEAPAEVPAGLRHVSFENKGSTIHEAMFVRLPDGMDARGYVASVERGELFPAGALDRSGPGLTSPGETVEIWLRLEPGNYILICWNADHNRTTPVRELHVTAAAAHDDEPPPADAVLEVADYRFRLDGELRAGVRTVKITNAGPSKHEADLFRLLPGHEVADLVRWRKDGGDSAAPAVALGGALDSHDVAQPIWLRRAFAPGRYAIHCEMPMSDDAPGGTAFATHADAGMVTTFEVRD